ncbi:MAG: HPr family phosphocarrier protein [Thermoanaerobaculaceae bacterium]|nr:HPr family phosphocarrier protein [Thermoanaerobaculaceae bacterium]
MVEKDVMITNKLGLHARAAAKLVNLAGKFHSHITISTEQICADAKSILGVLTLAAGKDTMVKIEAEGPDEKESLEAIIDLIENKFGED